MKAKIYILDVPYGQYVYAAESYEQLKPTIEAFEETSYGDVTAHEDPHATADVPFTPYCLGGHQE